MKRTALLLLVGLLAGCNVRGTPAAAYRHFGDQLKASTLGIFGSPCIKSVESGPNDVVTSTPNRECYSFDPPARMSGIWIDDFEGSAFLPTGTRFLGDAAPYGSGIWLNTYETPAKFPLAKEESDFGKAYALTFIGRRTTYPGQYGHMGGSGGLIVVDKLLSIREVARPGPGDVIR